MQMSMLVEGLAVPPRTSRVAKSVWVSSLDLGPRERVRRSDLCGVETGRVEERGGDGEDAMGVVVKWRGCCKQGCVWRMDSIERYRYVDCRVSEVKDLGADMVFMFVGC